MELDPDTKQLAPHLPLKVRVEAGVSFHFCSLGSAWSVDKYILHSCQSGISHAF